MLAHVSSRRRVGRVASLIAAAVLAPVAAQGMLVGPAEAVPPTMERVVSPLAPWSSEPTRTAKAQCDFGEVPVGGGARIIGGDDAVRLVGLIPAVREFVVTPLSGPVTAAHLVTGSYTAKAEEPAGGFARLWRLEAYAICMGGFDSGSYWISTADPAESSGTFKLRERNCGPIPNNRVIGSGAEVEGGNGQVGLQLVRPDGPRTIARATARTDENYERPWALRTYAICAENVARHELTMFGTIGESGGTTQCGADKFVFSVGGGGSLTDSGPFFIKELYPAPDLKSFTVQMTGRPIGGTAIGAICGYP